MFFPTLFCMKNIGFPWLTIEKIEINRIIGKKKGVKITINQQKNNDFEKATEYKSKSIKKPNVFQYFFEPCHASMMPSSTKNQSNCTNNNICNIISILLASCAANI